MRTHYLIGLFLGAIALVGASCGGSSIEDGGVYKSWDGAENWEQKVYVGQDKKDRPVLIDGAQIKKMFIEPGNENIIYALAAEGLYKTYDHGEVWKKLDIDVAGVNHIAIDPNFTNNIYIARGADIIKSTEGGEGSFEIVYRDSQGAIISRIAVDWYYKNRQDERRLYAITTTGTILKSEDEGGTWRSIHKTDDPLTQMVMSPKDSRILYVMEYEKAIWKTTDGGKTWDNLFETNAERIDREEAEKADEELVFEEIEGEEVEESEDDDTPKITKPRLDFEESFPDATEVLQLAMDPNDPDIIYITSKMGILRSDDGGETWERFDTVISDDAEAQNSKIRNIIVKPEDSKTILFSVGRLIHKTEDGGKTWKVIENFPSARDITVLLFNPEENDIIYAGVETPEDDDKNKSLFIGS